MTPLDNTKDISPKRIYKKTVQPYYDDVLNGKKTFDLRINDFDTKIGDILVLQEWDEKNKMFTGREIELEISYLLETSQLKIYKQADIDKYGFKIMGIKKITK